MPTALITHPTTLLHDMGPYHPECPGRLTAIRDQLIASGLDAGLVHHVAPAATGEELARVHDEEFIAQVENASPRAGLIHLDPDTAMNRHSLEAAKHACGAVVLATDLVMSGNCETAFCAVRPPGHHAERARAMGFCIFNNIAVGAAHAMAAYGLERVAIVDFDVHHGNGTEDIFSNDERVLMVGTFQHPLYPYSGFDCDAPNMINVPLPGGSGSREFQAAVREFWLPALEEHRPQMIFISAGFDAHREDPLAGLNFHESDYAWVTRELMNVADTHANGRVVSALEGGYSLSALGRSAVHHIRELTVA